MLHGVFESPYRCKSFWCIAAFIPSFRSLPASRKCLLSPTIFSTFETFSKYVRLQHDSVLFQPQPCFSCLYFFPLASHALKDIYCWQTFFFWWSVNFVISPSVNHRLCRSRPVDTELYPTLSHYSILHPTPLQPTSPHTRSPIKAIFLKLFKGSSKSSEVAVLLRSDIFAFAFKVLWALCIVR